MKEKKTYRLDQRTVTSIDLIQEAIKENLGTKLYAGQVIEMAVITLYKEFQQKQLLPEDDELTQAKIEALKGEFGDEIQRY